MLRPANSAAQSTWLEFGERKGRGKPGRNEQEGKGEG